MNGRLCSRMLRSALAVALLASASLALAKGPAVAVTADQAWQALLDGNRRFVNGDLDRLVKNSDSSSRKLVAAGQKPYATVLTCSDSRLPPEILFDRGLGEIFAVRVAGNIVSPHELGSMEYAAEHLKVPLIVILGHERCGAVTATVDSAGPVEGNIGSLINSILPAVNTARSSGQYSTHDELVEGASVENIKLVAQNILRDSPALAHMVSAGHVKIVGAKYDLDTGALTMVPLGR